MLVRLRNTCLVLFALPFALLGQRDFDLRLDTVAIPGLPGLHSFAVATHGGKWLLVGGRLDGMHQKFNSFPTSSANQEIRVVEPEAGMVWHRPLAELPDSLQEQLRSTNMAFFQQDETLLFAGGYGRSELAQNHITYPYLTLIDVPGLMDAVVNGGALQPHFQQIRDTFFAVTGGQLQALADTFYLVGGHRFEGVYSANSSQNLTQFYTDAIRKFTLGPAAGAGWEVTHQSTIIDELNLHRRDYNLAPQVFPDGGVGLTAFSGVFQPGLALTPFQNLIEIRPSGHSPVNGFSQFLAHYHCARAALYAGSAKTMHTLFFGGISQYSLDEKDSMIRDNRLPFVKTLSRISRLADGRYEEVAFDAKLPFYTGTSAEFIPAAGVPMLYPGIIDYDQLPEDSRLLGYIAGGIVTPDNQPNPLVANTVGITSASTQLIRVYLEKKPLSAAPEKPLDGRLNLGLRVSPNPANEQWTLHLILPRAGQLRCTLQDAGGRILRQLDWGQQPAGAQQIDLPAGGLAAGTYGLTLNLNGAFMETTILFKQ